MSADGVSFKLRVPKRKKKYGLENFNLRSGKSNLRLWGIHMNGWLGNLVSKFDTVVYRKNSWRLKKYRQLKKCRVDLEEKVVFAFGASEIADPQLLPSSGTIATHSTPEEAAQAAWMPTKDGGFPKDEASGVVTALKILSQPGADRADICADNKLMALPFACAHIETGKLDDGEMKKLYARDDNNGGFVVKGWNKKKAVFCRDPYSYHTNVPVVRKMKTKLLRMAGDEPAASPPRTPEIVRTKNCYALGEPDSGDDDDEWNPEDTFSEFYKNAVEGWAPPFHLMGKIDYESNPAAVLDAELKHIEM